MNAVTPDALRHALEVGLAFDLRHCVYGPPHWAGEGIWAPSRYYHFLAGLVRTTGGRRIVELGTHYGGSICAMHTGLDPNHPEPAVLVTCDLTRLNEEGIGRYPEIRRVQGDSLARGTIEAVCDHFKGEVDILYVDTVHTYDQTRENVAVYANRLKPRLIVIDDIRLTHDTRRLWADLASAGAGVCIDISELVDRESAGFGIIDCRYPFQWPESSAMALAVKRAVWGSRRAITSQLSEPTKDRLRAARDRLRGVSK